MKGWVLGMKWTIYHPKLIHKIISSIKKYLWFVSSISDKRIFLFVFFMMFVSIVSFSLKDSFFNVSLPKFAQDGLKISVYN